LSTEYQTIKYYRYWCWEWENVSNDQDDMHRDWLATYWRVKWFLPRGMQCRGSRV